jgi:predicted nucleic acid-binding protein
VTRVVHASVAVKWFLPEGLSTEARRLLSAEHELLAPDLLRAELGNVLWTARGQLRDFSRVPLEFHPAARWANPALALAIRHGVTVHDGLYLALAAGSGCRLVTADRRLRETCDVGALHGLVEWLGEIR